MASAVGGDENDITYITSDGGAHGRDLPSSASPLTSPSHSACPTRVGYVPITVTTGWHKDFYSPKLSCSASLFELHSYTLSLFALHCLWVPYAVLYETLSLDFTAVLSTLCKETVCLHSMLAQQQSDLLSQSSDGLAPFYYEYPSDSCTDWAIT